jgi:hypothetical protein
MIARPALFSTLLALAALTGCGPKPSGSTIYQFETNDYKFEYDGEQKRVTLGPGLMRMVRHPEDIEVSKGTLRVGPRDYGAVELKDRISVVAGKVAVNGRERTPLTP